MNTSTKFPMYFPGKAGTENKKYNLLVADLRKDKCVLAEYSYSGGSIIPGYESTYQTAQFSSFEAMAKDFEGVSGKNFDRISIAAPGPVIFGRCETENLPWILDSQTIREKTGAHTVFLLNDMEATAYSLASLEGAEVVPIHDSEKIMPGNVAILAPGNGLGEAGLFWDGENLRPFATEGGHTEFSPRTDMEVDFYQYLNRIYGIVSWENVLSKDGLYNIYRFLRDVQRHEEPQGFAEKVQTSDFLKILADEGRNRESRLINLTLQMFSEFLAREANYLALKLKATGGLIITGEIAEELRKFIDREKFYSDFKISDKMEALLKDIPLYFIFNKKAILQGAAHFGALSQ